MFKLCVYSTVYGDLMAQVQLRLPEEMISEIDCWVSEGRFKNRSDAIKSIISLYQEREKAREFFMLLNKRSKQAKKAPEKLVPLEEV
jgi:Arc/MetJ-type ribon-helix-helix transcriptional regulator